MNMSKVDRFVRLVLASVFAYLGIFHGELIGDEILAMAIGGFGLFNLLVVFVGFCPVYFLAGISTFKPVAK